MTTWTEVADAIAPTTIWDSAATIWDDGATVWDASGNIWTEIAEAT